MSIFPNMSVALAHSSPTTLQPAVKRPLIVGNWKMNGSQTANQALLNAIGQGLTTLVSSLGAASHASSATHLANIDIAICVPFTYLLPVIDYLRQTDLPLPIFCGAQDVSLHAQGAYTGEVSAAMLADCGCQYVLVGHSERRLYHAETAEQVWRKAQAALQAGLTPIICVGETLAERKQDQTIAILEAQLSPMVLLNRSERLACIIAYEPVWAIGTGLQASPAQAQAAHAHIRAYLTELEAGCVSTRILYGGSLKPDNAQALLEMPDVDGGLIGGAALQAEAFLSIIASAAVLSQ